MALEINAGISPYWYIPESQKKEEQPARFKLAPLTQMALIDAMEDSFTDNDGKTRITGRGVRVALKAGLLEWENVTIGGEKLPCIGTNFEKLPSPLLRELSNKLILDAMFGEQEAKNS